MREQEIKKYESLNAIAEQDGIVIFGSTEDMDIPLCELKQAFDIKESCYNRSFGNLSADEACDMYTACIKVLSPETLLLHIGFADIERFKTSPEGFAKNYRKLISQIKSSNKKCRIAVVSLKNYNCDSTIAKLNKQLKYIADSEKCEFCDISQKKLCNPQQTKDVVSFVYNIGFVHPLKNKIPLNDLVKMFFCFEN